MTARFLCVGTHHKTGTVWMRRTFHKFAEAHGIPIIRIRPRSDPSELPATGPALVVNWASAFPRWLLDSPEARALHMIRDPRDVLISGARYHLTARTGNEKWLARPRPEFGGQSYKERINALPDLAARLRFEMHHKHKATLAEMLAWPYGHPHAVDLRYEDMIGDTDCALFRAALETMAVAGFDIDGLVESYWTHSLFGGIADRGNRTGNVAAHIRSGRKAQWREALPRAVARDYAADYGAALVRLGYATDDTWVEDCPEEVAGAETAGAAPAARRHGT